MNKKLAIGIDIGGTLTKVGLVDQEGKLYDNLSFRTSDVDTFDEYLVILKNHIVDLTSKLSFPYEIIGMGIGAPNANHFHGTIENAANLKWKGLVPIIKKLNEIYHFNIYITNDANAAAIGEKIFGKAKEMDEFLVITLGTGLGAGLFCNGKIVYGYDSQAAELGHVNYIYNGRLCGCKKRGCLETYVSSTGLKRTIFELMADSMVHSELRDISFNELRGEVITKAAENGDPIALEAFRKTGEILGIKLADFVAHTHPEAIFLTGGLAKSGKWIFEPTRKYLEENLLDIYKGKIKLLPSGMIEKNIAILGAASLVFNHNN